VWGFDLGEHGEQLGEDAPDAPHIDGGGVLLQKDELGGAVPS